MLFSSLIFIYLFLPLTLLAYFLAKKKFQNLILLVASLIFYLWAVPSLVSVLGISIAVNYVCGFLVGRSRKKIWRKSFLILGLFLNLGMLVYFKYSRFFAENINDLIHIYRTIPVALTKIIMPLGISFFTFKAITYLISVYREETPVQKNFLDLALYISIFPQLIAGPISRYRDLAPQLDSRERTVTSEKFASGINRFVLGLAKKVLIANSLAYVADQIYSIPGSQLNSPLAWLAVVCFALQIYYDFSGYSDMAIGLGRMFGFTFAENFNFPYVSSSLREFWKRWHITLSTWFRDYLFLPIAYSVSRKLPREKYFRIRSEKIIYLIGTAVTFFLCGFWHGAAWTFIFWGMLHGAFLITEQSGFGKILKKIPAIFRHLYLILFLLISWVFFRADSIQDAVRWLGVMFKGNGKPIDWLRFSGYLNVELVLTGLLAILGCTTFFSRIVARMNNTGVQYKSVLNRITFFTLKSGNLVFIILIMLLVTLKMVAGTINPFIYFKF